MYIYIYIHTCMAACMANTMPQQITSRHARSNTYVHAYIRACMHATLYYTHALHATIHARMHECSANTRTCLTCTQPTQARPHTHQSTHANIPTQIYTRMNACKHAWFNACSPHHARYMHEYMN